MIEVNKAGEVWIFAEQQGGQLVETPLELLSKGRELADTLGVKLGAVLLGDDIAEKCKHQGRAADITFLHSFLQEMTERAGVEWVG